MKKIIFFLIVFFSCYINVNADYTVTNYRVNINILSNGDVEIIEAFKLDGDYNGFERVIDYKGNYDNYYGDYVASVDKKLYDASDIKIDEVRAINFDDEDYLKYGDLFTLKQDCKKGEHGVYSVTKTNTGENIKIYNPSKMNKDFYLKYTLKNMVITHKDILELGMFIFTNLNEDIHNLEININLPDTLYIWTHKKSNINKDNGIKIIVDKLNANEKFDIRILFDGQKTNKKTNEIVIDKIKNIEENLSEKIYIKNTEYNNKKEEAYNLVNKVINSKNRNDYNKAYEAVINLKKEDELKTKLLIDLISIEPKIERKEEVIKVLLTSLVAMWVIGLLLYLYYFYRKYEKKIRIDNKNPILENPSLIGFLMKRKTNINDLVSDFIYLINKNVVKFEKKGKNYKFFLNNLDNLSNIELKLINFIFNDKKETSINQINKKSKKDFDNYLKLYSNWIDSINCEANKLYFYNLFIYKLVGIFYCILGIILGSLLLNKDIYFNSTFLIIISFIFLIFFVLLYKRTEYGKEQYYKWKKYLKNDDCNILYLLCTNRLTRQELKNEILINDLYYILKMSLKNAYNSKKLLYE